MAGGLRRRLRGAPWWVFALLNGLVSCAVVAVVGAAWLLAGHATEVMSKAGPGLGAAIGGIVGVHWRRERRLLDVARAEGLTRVRAQDALRRALQDTDGPSEHEERAVIVRVGLALLPDDRSSQSIALVMSTVSLAGVVVATAIDSWWWANPAAMFGWLGVLALRRREHLDSAISRLQRWQAAG